MAAIGGNVYKEVTHGDIRWCVVGLLATRTPPCRTTRSFFVTSPSTGTTDAVARPPVYSTGATSAVNHHYWGRTVR